MTDEPTSGVEAVRGVMPNPTDEMLASPEFEAVWRVIKSWDINVPEAYAGYCGANGSHVAMILAALATPPASPMRPEDEAEAFIQAAVDRAPEPLRRLGEWLAGVLDEDDWKTAERMLLGAALTPPASPSPAPAAVEELVARLVWQSTSSGFCWHAASAVGRYFIEERHADFRWSVEGWPGERIIAGTLDEAKAAAQADYTARILSALDATALSTLAADKARLVAAVSQSEAERYRSCGELLNRALAAEAAAAAKDERIRELASTIAGFGVVFAETRRLLKRVRASGRTMGFSSDLPMANMAELLVAARNAEIVARALTQPDTVSKETK